MRIVIDVGHPSQVHFFRNFAHEMSKKGHSITITASDKDIAIDLLQHYKLDYINLGSYGRNTLQKIRNVPIMDLKMIKAAKAANADLLLGFGSVRAAHAAWALNKPCIIFDGDAFTYHWYKWFANTVCAFSGWKVTGKRILSVPGYKELAYLHPRWFTPSLSSREERPVVIMRFTARAFHDVGKTGFDDDMKMKYATELSKYATVHISSEGPLSGDLEQYGLKIKPSEMLDALANASLLVTDSGSMTTEAAVLGIPVVRCNTLIGQSSLGIFQELENEYGLIFNVYDPNQALQKAVELAQTPDLRIVWEQKRRRLLQEKIDVTSFMIWFVENYPQSRDSADAYLSGMRAASERL